MHGITDKMVVEKDGAIGWIVFNNPERRNALTVEMWQAIPTILDHLEAESAIRVIALKGAGDKAFISGADISQFEQQRSSPEAVANYETIADRAMQRLLECPRPTIAMIRGYCMGGGVGVALSCDLRIAGESARFAIPAAKLGVGYRHGGLKSLINLVGPAFAKEIFYTARQFTAAEAAQMGLINRSVADDGLATYVRDYCETIATNAPLTIKAVKQTVAEITRNGTTFDHALCERLVEECFASEDYVEGRRAFMEKRTPIFRGR